MPNNKYTQDIQQLERLGKFDVDVRPVEDKYVARMQPNKFKYISKNIFVNMYKYLIKTVLFLFGPLVSWLLFDLRIKGRKNLKAIKKSGAMVVANHVNLLDALYFRQIKPTRSMYYLAAEHNNKKGLSGLTLRVAGVLPLSSDFQLSKQLDNTITTLLNKKALITIYAEQAMWIGYTKIRPFKNGAFHYAVKNNVPVVPVVALFRKTYWWDKLVFRKYKVTLQILPPIFADQTLGYKQKLLAIKDKCHSDMVECASNFYGVDSDATHYIDQENK